MKKHSVWMAVLCLAAGSPAAVRYKADKNHTTIGFHAPILGFGKVTGKFTGFEVTIVHDEKDISKSSVTVSIQASSVNTGVPDRDAHLRTADFFDVEKYPEITFESTRIEARKDGTYVAHGIFRMRGVQKEMALPFQLKVFPAEKDGSTSVGVRAGTRLNRREFGMTWKHTMVPGFVGDEIEIDLAIVTRLGVRDESPDTTRRVRDL